MNRKIEGFGIVGIIVIAVGLVIVGLVGWRVWDGMKSKDSSNQTSVGANTEVADPYVGWKTYTSSLAGYSIKYPSDWTARITTGNNGLETLFIVSPDKFEIRLDSSNETTDSSADVCGSTCLATNTLTNFTAPKYGSLKISADKQGAGNGSIYALNLLAPSGSLSIVSPTKSNATTTVTGNFQGWTEEKQTQETLEQFTGSSSVKTSIQIYKSLAY